MNVVILCLFFVIIPSFGQTDSLHKFFTDTIYHKHTEYETEKKFNRIELIKSLLYDFSDFEYTHDSGSEYTHDSSDTDYENTNKQNEHDVKYIHALATRRGIVLTDATYCIDTLKEYIKHPRHPENFIALHELVFKESHYINEKWQKAFYDIQQIVYDPESGKYIGITGPKQIDAIQKIIERFEKEVNEWKSDNTYLEDDYKSGGVNSKPYDISWDKKIRNNSYNRDLFEVNQLCASKNLDNINQAYKIADKYNGKDSYNNMHFIWKRASNEYIKKNKTIELRKSDNILVDRSQKNVIISLPVSEALESNEFVNTQLPKNLETDIQLLQSEKNMWDEFKSEPRYEARLQSWQESIRTSEFTTKNYELTPEALNLFKQLDLDSKAFSMLYGNQIHHAIHQEFVDIVNNAGLIYLKTKNEESRELAKEIITCSEAGSSYLKAGFILKATYTANFCWALLDCGIAMSEGAVQGLKNTGEFLTHPIETATKLSQAIFDAGYYLGKILTTLVNDGIIAIKNPEEAATRIEQRVEKINTIIQAIEDRLKTKQPRDIAKKSTEIIVESWCTGKILSFLAKFLKNSNNKFSEIIKKLGPTEEAVAITAEGLPVQVGIAEEGISHLSEGIIKVGKIEEFFDTVFGKLLKDNAIKIRGNQIYKVVKKVDHAHIKKGDYFYLDKLHSDHIEVFDGFGNARSVLNLDGSLNIKKTEIAVKQARTIKI